MLEQKPKPCPFCKGTVAIRDAAPDMMLHVGEYGCIFATSTYPIEAWNRRTGSAGAGEGLREADLEKLVDAFGDAVVGFSALTHNLPPGNSLVVQAAKKVTAARAAILRPLAASQAPTLPSLAASDHIPLPGKMIAQAPTKADAEIHRCAMRDCGYPAFGDDAFCPRHHIPTPEGKA